MFADTVPGAVASANLYSLVETAKANNIEPHACLSHLFAQLPPASTVEDFEALLPWNVKAALPTSHLTLSRNANTPLFDRLLTSSFAILGLGTRKYRPSRMIWASA